MTGKDSDIDLSLSNIWQSWYNFRKGKRSSPAILEFEYYLEKNLLRLCSDLNNSRYRHGGYTYFRVTDTKPRDISVASVRDRVVHRLLYDYLVPIWDKTFIYDAWSCRKNKGLQGAINRAQSFAIKYPKYYVWRADIKKMFDSIDHAMMKQLIQRRVKSKNVLWLIDEVIDSYNALASQPAHFFRSNGVGLPIGNLTSQIMSNINLNELDRFMVHEMKPAAYLRYGDDWLCFVPSKLIAQNIRLDSLKKLNELGLQINTKVDSITPVWKGIPYLGVNIWPEGHYLKKVVRKRVKERLRANNVASYRSLVLTHDKSKRLNEFDWGLIDLN